MLYPQTAPANRCIRLAASLIVEQSGSAPITMAVMGAMAGRCYEQLFLTARLPEDLTEDTG